MSSLPTLEALQTLRREAAERPPECAEFPLQPEPIVLYGAGPLGRLTLARMRRAGLAAAAFCDSNPARWGSTLDTVPVLSPDQAIEKYASSAVFVVTIYNGAAVRADLQKRGCARVGHFADLFHRHAAAFLPFCGIADPAVILDAWPEVQRASQVWDDAQSTAEFVAQLRWRLRLPDTRMPRHDPPAHCYFPEGLFQFAKPETYLDCGAYDGDSVRAYLARRPSGGDSNIIALEPDPATFAKLCRVSESLPGLTAANLRIEPWAVTEVSGPLSFDSLGTVASGVNVGGAVKVHGVAIDDLQVVPTLIKMDVEGYELPALRGAQATLRAHRPVLAISLYHHASDLWAIPAYLKSLVPQYHLFLRRYAEDCWELVLYAVPSERLSRLGAGT